MIFWIFCFWPASPLGAYTFPPFAGQVRSFGEVSAVKLDCMHHVAVLVSDYQAALAFYRDKLGLPLLRDVDRPAQGDRILTLGLAQGELEIFVKPAAPSRGPGPAPPGLPGGLRGRHRGSPGPPGHCL